VAEAVLEIKNLETHLASREGAVKAVNDVSFTLLQGETLGIVGESGSGKTMTALSIMGLVPNPPGEVVGGSVVLDGENLTELSDDEVRKRRSTKMGMVFQDPATSLNPTMKVGPQIAETMQQQLGFDEATARQRTVEILERVGIPSPESRYYDYPFQFSGGMRQRAMIAIALSCDPLLLIADEPTTALDVTVQAQLLDLVRDLKTELGMSVIWITHDLGVVADLCDRVAVMYAGHIVETGSVDQMFTSPKHRYTSLLLKSLPSMEKRSSDRLTAIAGLPPSLANLKPGCPFAPRCDAPIDRCLEENPVLTESGDNRFAACWNTLNDS
jgi:oligopeptide/dipeptide ABC transporter ATP-binding protein